MLELIIELLVEAVFDVFLQVLCELALELGWESMTHALGKEKKANPLLAGLGIVVMGAGLGLIGGWVFPHRVIKPSSLPGLSLVLTPLGTGTIMQVFGSWRRRRGGEPSCLATFWGGALFAFSMALVRWLMVGRG